MPAVYEPAEKAFEEHGVTPALGQKVVAFPPCRRCGATVVTGGANIPLILLLWAQDSVRTTI